TVDPQGPPFLQRGTGLCEAPSLNRLGSSQGAETPHRRCLSTSGSRGLRVNEVMRPGGRLVVMRSCDEASVEDADPTVGEMPDRGVVSLAAGTERVVVRACTGRRVQRAERPPIAAIGESLVARGSSRD